MMLTLNNERAVMIKLNIDIYLFINKEFNIAK